MNRKLLPMVACALTTSSIFCGLAAEPQTEQDKAVVEFKELGGFVKVDEKDPSRPVISVRLQNTGVTDAGLKYLEGLTQLRDLDLGGTKVTDTGLQHLKGLPQLRQLRLFATKVTDAGTADLKRALPNCSIRR